MNLKNSISWANAAFGGLLVLGCYSTVDTPSPEDEEDTCGNGIVDPGEDCDDGNHSSYDGCLNTCEVSEGYFCDSSGCQTTCGDGIAAGNEVCDDGTTSGNGYCATDCSSEIGRCGDGILQPTVEHCDIPADGLGGAGGAGNGEFDSGCSADCKPAKGFLCSRTTNTCNQTGLPPDELVNDHLEEICTYIIALLGGPDNRIGCNGFTIEPGSVATCVQDIEFDDTCTVEQLEYYARGKTQCEFFETMLYCN